MLQFVSVSGLRLYDAPFSCDIGHMGGHEKKFADADELLAEFEKTDEELSAVRDRCLTESTSDLAAVDQELEALSAGLDLDLPTEESELPRSVRDLLESGSQAWENEHTDVEVIEMTDDFVLLVDEDVLHEAPADEEGPQASVDPEATSTKTDPDSSFFKKLFSSRRNSDRPQK